MARIENNYTIYWETVTKIIQNDYTESLKGLNVDFATALADSIDGHIITPSTPLNEGASAVPCITHYHADSIAEIDAKVQELELIDTMYIVTPH